MLDSISTASRTLVTPAGVQLEYETYGSGPPLVLVHGALSDHRTNWMHVKPMLAERFTVFAIARRGRGRTDATHGHALADEVVDVMALIREIGPPVYLLGHSYGAHVALGVATATPRSVARLVLYEPPRLGLMEPKHRAALAELGAREEWDALAWTFFSEVLEVPLADLASYRASDDWAGVLADAPATLEDLTALPRHSFDLASCAELTMPVLLQSGSESPPHLWLTNALARHLPACSLDVLQGQAHEGMTTAPEQYAKSVIRFLETPAS
ncbi:alpha/beta fold hydrolase [Tsuneonella sp. HG249]